MSDPGTSAPMASATLPQVISNTDRQAAIDAIVAAHGEAARNTDAAEARNLARAHTHTHIVATHKASEYALWRGVRSADI
jgi:NADPH-dependent glutamate synthase beta subunit-like oxidoreductase